MNEREKQEFRQQILNEVEDIMLQHLVLVREVFGNALDETRNVVASHYEAVNANVDNILVKLQTLDAMQHTRQQRGREH